MTVKKILLITEAPIPHFGGMSTHILLLQKELRNKGYEVDILSGNKLRDPKIKLKGILKGIINFENLRNSWMKERIKYLKSQLDLISENYDIIHSHDPVASKVYKNEKSNLVTTIHGPMVEHAKEHGRFNKSYIGYLTEIEQECFSKSDILISVDTGQKEILKNKGVNENMIRIIYNSINVNETQKKATNFKGTKKFENEKFILIARRLVPKNGVDFGIKAFLKWTRDKDVKLVIAGDGPLRNELEQMVLNSTQKEKVAFLGNTSNDEVLYLMSKAICSIVPSLPTEGVVEATSLTALEALALNIPLIASNIGGLKEIDMGKGIINLVEPDNTDQLILALDKVYKGEKMKSTKSAEHITKNFGSSNWANKHLDIYNSIHKGN